MYLTGVKVPDWSTSLWLKYNKNLIRVQVPDWTTITTLQYLTVCSYMCGFLRLSWVSTGIPDYGSAWKKNFFQFSKKIKNYACFWELCHFEIFNHFYVYLSSSCAFHVYNFKIYRVSIKTWQLVNSLKCLLP